ncbi:hypothetical protein HNY73_000064 [Argiope bruennichi]|uniref:Uncharacterized protein n=1 Tax=Argiope bruennichi TaxID=94029 RepID=A0A8T0FY02_ARGBR|nr:hypothetical protein HNY73_000064 [Argiope bruennichi]
MCSDVEQGLRVDPDVDVLRKGCFWIKRRAGPLLTGLASHLLWPSHRQQGRSAMAAAGRVLLVLALLSVGITTLAVASESEDNNQVSAEDGSMESRSDYPDIDDLSEFFDFDLGTSSESEKNHYNKPKTSRNKYYYYYKSDGSRYYERSNFPKKQVVTPGSHYKPQDDKEVLTETTNVDDSNSTLSKAVIGQYQISVVDANNPIFTKLGLKKEDLEKLSGYTKRSISNVSMVGSDSIPPATYAENPRPDYPEQGYAPNHQHPPTPNTHSYEPHKHSQYDNDRTERQYRPNEYYPADNHQPQRSYGQAPGPAQPPPQGSYDAKSYQAVQNSAHQYQSGYNYGQPPPPSPPAYDQYSSQGRHQYPAPAHNQYSGPPSNHYPAPPGNYAPKRSSGEPWRATPVHTDWDDKQSKKPESYHQHGPYPPHPPPVSYSSTPSNSVSHYPKSTYSSSDKPGYRYATYTKPQGAPKPSYSSPSTSSEYHSHKPSYSSSSGYSSSAKAPSRAGSVSYPAPSHHHHHDTYHEPSKPGITIRLKAKSPSHHGGEGGGGHGLNIPVSLNPFDVVKKLLPSLNPLNNKKVTIGITIENKKENHHDYHSY